MTKAISEIMVTEADLKVADVHRRWLLARHPLGPVKVEDFVYVEDTVPLPPPGKFLVRVLWLSIDPKQRLLMNNMPRNVEQVPLFGTMFGMAVGEVVLSKNDAFEVGDIVVDLFGWQSHAIADGRGHYVNNPYGTRRIDPSLGPISTALGVLGTGGLTAYFSVLRELKPQAGETIVVSSAAGNVGLIAGQIAKIHGARVIGLTSTDAKCHTIVRDFGYDDAINYRTTNDLSAAIRRIAPKGVDMYYDNVGGSIAAAVSRTLNSGARVTLVGVTEHYGEVTGAGKAWTWPQRDTMSYFIVHDYHREVDSGIRQLAAWIKEEKLRYREDIVEGLENAPTALVDLFGGGNLGKRVVRVAANPPGIA